MIFTSFSSAFRPSALLGPLAELASGAASLLNSWKSEESSAARLYRIVNGDRRPRMIAVNRPDSPHSAFEPLSYKGQQVHLHYFEAGRGNPETLLLIHGFASNAYQWNRIFDELSDRYHVVAIDLPGHGYSSCLNGHDYDFANVLPDLLNAFLDQKGLKGVTLVGSSLGGGLSQLLASGNERIRKILLFGSSGCTDQIEKVALFVQGAILAARWPLESPPPYFFERLGTLLTLWHYVHPTSATLSAHDVEEFSLPYRGDLEKIRARADYARQIRDLSVSRPIQAEILRRQKAIRQPVLYVYSEADRAIPPSVPGALLRFIENSRLIRIGAEEVPTAGHTLMSDTPALALQIIEDAMDETIDLSPGTAGGTRTVRFDPATGRYDY